MSLLNKVLPVSSIPYNEFDIILGLPGSRKTTLGATYPKPMLYVQIGDDGGGSVLKPYSDEEVSTIKLDNDYQNNVHVVKQLNMLLDELLQNTHRYKTIFIDPYSSVEESYVNYLINVKGKSLNLDERTSIGKSMIELRDKLVELSKSGKVNVVLASHVKTREVVDTAIGETNMNIIPKMSVNNGNNLLERASNVMYCCRRTVVNLDGTKEVKFLTYIGAHPNMDTKLRTRTGKQLTTPGIYIENATYADIEKFKNGGEMTQTIKVIEKANNPFDKEEEVVNGW